MTQPKKLIKVSGEANNNKYYDMTPNADGTFTAKWGRVEGGKGESMTYPISMFDKKYREKVRGGYVDVTYLLAETTTDSKFAIIKNNKINSLVNTLQSYSNKSIKENYTISAEKVTVKQVEEAQKILKDLYKATNNDLTDKYTPDKHKDLNKKLEELYVVIPRKMKKVADFLVPYDVKKKDAVLKFNERINVEQENIDVMSGQVSIIKKTADHDAKDNILSVLGLDISDEIDSKGEELIKKLLGDDSKRLNLIYKVANSTTETKFNKDYKDSKYPERKLFWHGSRNENWWSIINSGLLLRPNAQISGKMFGYGIYFADKAKKSIGYTSARGSYWARGSAETAYLALYDVYLGNPMEVARHDHYMSNLDYSGLKKRGNYDSLFAKGGYDLINNEFIIYQEHQCTIKYLVEIK